MAICYFKKRFLGAFSFIEAVFTTNKMIAVVIPCYKVSGQILKVISQIGPEVDVILVIDDCCPEQSGKLVEKTVSDNRIRVVYNDKNLGVGGAVITGYRIALSIGVDIIIKIDGDGQMDPRLIPDFVEPIIGGYADYTKGNRFWNLENLCEMPGIRIFGNAILSFMSKLSTGYWDLFDPTNGYTAIHANAARYLPFDKISYGYFFESDILFRLNTIRATVVDIPMDAKYGEEVSNLKISGIAGEFFFKHFRNFIKRIFYNYYLRDMSIASIELPIGLFLFLSGVIFGGHQWLDGLNRGEITPPGTVMLAALPIIVGFQLLLAFLSYDIMTIPKRTLHKISQSKTGNV